MEEKLKKLILQYFKDVHDKTGKVLSINSNTLANSLNIKDTDSVKNACEELGREGYFDVSSIGGNNLFIENVNLKKIDNINKHLNDTIISTSFIPADIPFVINAIDVPECFGVRQLADSFVRVIDAICSSEVENVAMMGIFAPWGRGKTYFFNVVSRLLSQRNKKEKNIVHYDIIEFNAWKYQDTPAFWAYLYQTMWKSAKWWTKLLLSAKANWIRIIFIISFILFCIFMNDDIIRFVSGVAAAVTFLDSIKNTLHPALSIIKSNSVMRSPQKVLGLQSEIESSVESLLKLWISNRKVNENKILLYVDDIDRCDHTKMLEVIESLRTILENKEIKKRLIVVCSMDPQKIAAAMKIKYSRVTGNYSLKQTIRDQFDKLFVSTISLPELKYGDSVEYLSKLSGEQLKPVRKLTSSFSSDFSFDFGGFEKKPSPTVTINKNLLSQMLAEEIERYGKRMTPRQISILYYRCLFAVLLKNSVSHEIDKSMIDIIIRESYPNNELELVDEDIDGVIQVVVPYRAHIFDI